MRQQIEQLRALADASEGDVKEQALRDLATGMQRDEAVLIYPEGTRFSLQRQARAWKHLESRPALLERARAMTRVLPPRLRGPLTLLEAAPGEVLFVAHSGLEGAMHWGELTRGSLLDAVIKVRTWRVPAEQIPDSEEARIDWLYTQWEEMNRVVQAMEAQD